MLDSGGRQVHRLILGLDRMTNPTKWFSVQGAVKCYAIDKVIHA
jgi:hypothetical protein